MINILEDNEIKIIPGIGSCKRVGKHLEICFDERNELYDEYDFLSIASDIVDKEEFDAIIRFLDMFVPIENKTYFDLRIAVKIERMRSEDISAHNNPTISPKTYLMLDNNNGYIKIGRSINPKKRETTLQSEKPDITLLKICDCNIETKLHKMFKDKRVRGEWFSLSKEDISYIVDPFDFKDV